MPNKLLFPEKSSHHVLFLLYLFRDGKELLSGFHFFTKEALSEHSVQDVVNINKIMFERYGDLVDQAYSTFNETLIINEVPHSKTEYDETPGAEYPNENNLKDTLDFMRKIPVDETAESINNSNSKQREVFNVVHTWSKDYVKCIGYNVELVEIFLSGS